MKSKPEAPASDRERTEPDTPASAFASVANARTPSLARRALLEKSAAPSDTLSNWLDLLCKLLRLPAAEKDEIRSELDSHLRDRVRDFMLAGMAADESARRAIDELGNAADLAERFRTTSKDTQRRFLMNVAGVGLAATAVVFSVVAITQRSTDAAVARESQVVQDERVKAEQTREEAVRAFLVDALVQSPPERVPIVADMIVQAEGQLTRRGAAQLAWQDGVRDALLVNARPRAGVAADRGGEARTPSIRTSTYEPVPNEAMPRLAAIDVHLNAGDTYAAFFDQLTAGAKVSVRYQQLEGIGVSKALVLPGTMGATNAAAVIQALNDAMHGDAVDAIAARLLPDGTIVVSSQESFDRQEQTLATYDIAPIVQRRIENADEPVKASDVVVEVAGVITRLVQQQHWADNGGDRAKITKFGAKLFVEAPARFHPQIRWVLEELKANEEGDAHSRRGVPDAPPEAARTDRAVAVRWQDGVPTLRDLPLLNNMFTKGGSVTDKVGTGPLVIKATDDRKVQVIGPSGVMTASQIHVELPQVGTPQSADPSKPTTKLCTLAATDASAMAAFLQSLSQATPVLNTANGAPKFSVDALPTTNQLYVRADAQQVRRLDGIIELLDRGALTELAQAVPASRTYKPTMLSAAALRELLGQAFNTSPVLRQCAVDRIMEVQDGKLILTATADQLVLVDRLVSMVDPLSTR